MAGWLGTPGESPLYLDGINNPGFSGGPVIASQLGIGGHMAIVGVISGYRTNAGTFLFEDMDTGLLARENSGLILATYIGQVLRTIDANPIGYVLPK